jgi:uncharacterized integral membrane protein
LPWGECSFAFLGKTRAVRPLGILVAVVIVAGAVMLYIRRVYVRPWQSRRNTERLLRENEELDRRIAELSRERKDS